MTEYQPSSAGTSMKRERKVTEQEFKALLHNKAIRPASLEDVSGTHHQRALYRHPRTGQWYTTRSRTDEHL